MQDLEQRFPGKYLSVTSFRGDGTGVATPVWFVADDGRLLVKTDPQSFKVGRIRRNPEVSIALCSASGKLRGEPVTAQAEILSNSEELRHATSLLDAKYRVDRILIMPLYRLVQRLRRRPVRSEEVVLAITPRRDAD